MEQRARVAKEGGELSDEGDERDGGESDEHVECEVVFITVAW